MLYKIINNEWLQWKRDSRIKWLLLFLLLISMLALWHQLSFQSNLSTIRLNAQESSRKEWLAQELKHPHMAAHFGNYAYKKPSLLHCFDPGLSIYTGTSVYMEPHRQNDFLFSKSQESDSSMRFGWLSPALICQLILPLLIILFSFNAINIEKNNGTLALLLSQGASYRQILFAKTMAVFLLFELFFSGYLLLTVLSSHHFINAGVAIPAIFYVWLTYSLYFLCWSLLGVFVSSKINNVGSSMALLLLMWMCTNVIIPRVSANLAENKYPVISNYQFKKEISEAVAKGLDGHNSSDERAMKIEKEMLLKYKVDSVQQLPFNFEGFIMQQSEDYTSKVYDHYFDDIFQSLKNQKKVQSWVAAFSPFIAVRNVSMAGCNASLESEIDFQVQAENYRRGFVQNMNNDMKDKSAYGTFDTYRVDKNKYGEIKDLQVANRPLTWEIPLVLVETIWLLVWATGLLLLMLWSSKKQTLNR